MTYLNLGRVAAAAGFASALAAAGIVHAQATSTAPRAPTATAPAAAAAAAANAAPLPAGPNIPGLCVYSNEVMIANSAVGKFAVQRLQQLSAQASAEVTGELTAYNNDAKAFETQRATLTSQVQEDRALALRHRQEGLQQKYEQRQREMEATQQKAIGRVVTESGPLVRQAYGQRQCSVLIDRNAVLGASSVTDITADVIRLMDAHMTQFPFDRERLDQQPAAGAAPARQ